LRGGGSVSKVTMRGVQRKKIRLNTNEVPAFLDANQLHSQHRAFSRPMEFPFLGIWTSPDLVRYRHPKWPPDKPAQEIDVHWTGVTLGGKRPYFGCPHCKRRAIKLHDAGGFLTCRTCCNLRYKTPQVRRRACLFLKAKKIRAQLWAADSMPLGPWPPRPFAMSRKVYERHIRKLIKIEGAINTLERVASPAYRRERERNRDGSFVTQYDQLEMR
jgi:hypothetical protein